MAAPSLDYAGLLLPLADPARLGEALLNLLGQRYADVYQGCALHTFTQSSATYLFDLASAAGAPWEDRTVGAWTVTPAEVACRDAPYQRRYPMEPWPGGGRHDRGHLIPNLSGGLYGRTCFGRTER